MMLRALKISWVILLSWMFTAPIMAQELVPNPSFESFSSCPSSYGLIYLATGWDTPTPGTPDYFNACAPLATTVHVPLNLFGYQTPNIGQAYAGFYATDNPDWPEFREYVQIQLSDTLEAGKRYCVEFFVSLADSSAYAVDRIGAYLSPDPVSSPIYAALGVSPQIVSDSAHPILDTTSWVNIYNEYVALGNERYITIGHFVDNAHMDTVSTQAQSAVFTGSYYYLDDVSVRLCEEIDSVFDPKQIPNVFTPNNDGVNEGWTLKNLPDRSELRIYNRWGLEVVEAGTLFPLVGNYVWDGKTTSGDLCTTGTYYYILKAGTETYTGYILLIR